MALKVEKYRVRWSIPAGKGVVELKLEDGQMVQHELPGPAFQVVCAMLFNSDGKNPVYLSENGVIGTHEDIS